MAIESPFLIYNASAGSGKTFTLVKNYLKVVFASPQKQAFKNILALTFTNKAVAEMKMRILEMLMAFSDPAILKQPHPMFDSLSQELKMDNLSLHKKAKVILNTMVHNYAAFDVSTIDKFNHRLIRTFAHDLKLPLNFEVELDTKTVLSKAVDQLIDKAGAEEKLTKILIDFAIEKADEDKSWDISFDFNQIAQLLVNENDMAYVDLLKDKSPDDFKALKNQLQAQIKQQETAIIQDAEAILELIRSNILEHTDFTRGSLPNFVLKLKQGNFVVRDWSSQWQADLLDGNPLYPARVKEDRKKLIDALQPQFAAGFIQIKKRIAEMGFLLNVLNNITPLSVLNAIYGSLQDIKADEDIVLISEFNNLISTEIKSQPAPFIYERLGEKFRHYFIDEFQDTSIKQWENLIPLIDNAVSGQNLKGETGTVMLVGDAKQAIYRWRGGEAEQFIDLYTGVKHPFHVEQSVANLPANYRSLKAVVAFNNAFFKHLSSFVFSEGAHQQIYKNCGQDQVLEGEGLVELRFLEFEKDEMDAAYGQHVMEVIKKAQNNGFQLRDICIITRRSNEGIALAEYLGVQGIPVISSESLLLKNAPEVQFLANIIALASQSDNEMIKVEILTFLAEHLLHLEDKHVFLEQLVHLDAFVMFKKLEAYHLFFDFNQFLQLPFYESVENIIRQFHLNKTPNAYIQFFLDEILDYSQKNNTGFLGFTAHWNIKKESLSISSPQGRNAIQIMTIHKSKGLEFPVVVFPYANQKIYFDKAPKYWFPVDPKDFKGFSKVFVNINSSLENYGPLGEYIYAQHKSQLELDSINLLYVVLTRAVEQLYILSELELDKAQNENLKVYSGLFINYLKSVGLWDVGTRTYTFGSAQRILAAKTAEPFEFQKQFISVSKEDHNLKIVTNGGYMWNTEQAHAIERGNLIHLILSKIKTSEAVGFVFSDLESKGHLKPSQRLELEALIQNLVDHVQLKAYFAPGLTVFNERDIIVSNGTWVRPDRIVVKAAKEVVLIDYKTGAELPEHKQQVENYQWHLEAMGYYVVKKILVYINDGIQVKEF